MLTSLSLAIHFAPHTPIMPCSQEPQLTCVLKGDVYGKIVNEVIESSRTAFEEDGIDMSALDLLQSVGVPLSSFHTLGNGMRC